MAINVTKPSVNLREKLNELETNKGLKGNEILQAETAQEVRSLIGAGRKNLLINGGFDVWQRGTSFTTSSEYTADRWHVDNTSDGGGQVSDAPDDFDYSLKINPSTGNATVRQAIELSSAGKGGIFRSGQTFTLSFWVKSDNSGEAINIFIASSNHVLGTTTVHVSDGTTGLTTNTSWTKYTYTYTQSSDVGGSDTCYNIVPYVSSPSGAIYITGVQLELGSVATDFEHRSYGEELALCQRYYYKMLRHLSTMHNQGVNYTRVAELQFPVEMRTPPTLTASGGELATLSSINRLGANDTKHMSYEYSAMYVANYGFTDVTASAEL
jgi:hypothetical protein